jgi:hypothetical protein
MKLARYWISRLGLALGALGLLAGCGAAPVAEGQVGSVADQRPAQGSALDQDLLRQVDQALAQKKAAGEDVASAQLLRDSAVQVAGAGRAEEGNGNLKIAAQLLGVLRPVGNPPPGGNQLPAIPSAPGLPPAPAEAGATVLTPDFAKPDALKSWQRVGPSIPIGAPLWDVQGSWLVQRGVEGVESVDEQTGLVTGDPNWRDVTVRTAALVQGTKELGLIVRQSGESYYRFRALAVGTGSNQGNLILEKVLDGQVTQLATFDGPELSADVWHTLALTARGTTISATVDGKQVGSVEDASLAGGRAGVSTLAMSGAYFANVQVIGR